VSPWSSYPTLWPGVIIRPRLACPPRASPFRSVLVISALPGTCPSFGPGPFVENVLRARISCKLHCQTACRLFSGFCNIWERGLSSQECCLDLCHISKAVTKRRITRVTRVTLESVENRRSLKMREGSVKMVQLWCQ
jgi:hypothetical protein